MTDFLEELRSLSREYELKQIAGLAEIKAELRKAASTGMKRHIYKGTLSPAIVDALRDENLLVTEHPTLGFTTIKWLSSI